MNLSARRSRRVRRFAQGLCGGLFLGRVRLIRHWFSLGVVLGVSACASDRSTSIDAVGDWFASSPLNEASLQFNPRLRYLRAQADGQDAAYLVLGYVDDFGGRRLETWYSASRETVQVLDGRVVTSAGLPVNLTTIDVGALPVWPAVGSAVHYVSQRDHPDKGFGWRSRREMGSIDFAQVPRLVYRHVRTDGPEPLLPSSWLWFRDREMSGEDELWAAFAPTGLWMFTRQCLSANYCLSLQPWPPQPR